MTDKTIYNHIVELVRQSIVTNGLLMALLCREMDDLAFDKFMEELQKQANQYK